MLVVRPSTTPLATAVGESWAGWFYSHSQELPEAVLGQHGGKVPGDQKENAMALLFLLCG